MFVTKSLNKCHKQYSVTRLLDATSTPLLISQQYDIYNVNCGNMHKNLK
jgi:hypothetical protein